jgi:hypothetical protein
MINKKCANNVWKKHQGSPHVNIPMSSSSLPSIQKPWSLHIVEEWGHVLKNVVLQHEILTHYEELIVIVKKGA